MKILPSVPEIAGYSLVCVLRVYDLRFQRSSDLKLNKGNSDKVP